MAFVPSPWRKVATYAVNPWITPTTVIVDATAMTIPSTVRIDRSLFDQSCSRALRTLATISMAGPYSPARATGR